MTELLVPKCPRCGAELLFQNGTNAAFCKYCQAQVLLMDTAQPHPDGVVAEIEKKKVGLQLQEEELMRLQMEANQVLARINLIENPQLSKNARSGAVLFYVLFSMMIMMTGMLMPMFYFLDITEVWGIPHDLCPILGLVVIIIGVAGIAGAWYYFKNTATTSREQAMNSPEYQQLVALHQALLPQIAARQREHEMTQQQLRMLVEN